MMNIEQKKVCKVTNQLIKNEVDMGFRPHSFYWVRKFTRKNELIFSKKK